jgi:excisionase family DNA binding protein
LVFFIIIFDFFLKMCYDCMALEVEMTEFMSTKAVAQYLGIHEKQAYALAKRGAIPCTRVTGKWLFPKTLVDQWIEESAKLPGPSRRDSERPFLLAAGSDDPSLSILRDSYTRRLTPTALVLAPIGSQAGLVAVRDQVADLAFTHLVDMQSGEYNLPYVPQFFPAGAVVITLFQRELGLLCAPGNPLGLRHIVDLGRDGVRMINRQEGSGTRWYLDQELARLGLEATRLDGYEETVTTHLEVGLRVFRRAADIGLASHATARLLGLDFVPLTQERFEMVIPASRVVTRPVQILLDTIGSRDFRTRVDALGGYDTSEAGRLRVSS